MRRLLCALAAMVVLAATGASAQPYPAKPITIVVPFSAGGPTDTLARIMADRMSRTLGQTVLVDNTTGAAGTVGVGRVARAAPDGYIVGIGHWSTHVVNGAVYKLNYDLLNDFEPVALFASNPQLLVAKKAVAAKDLKEMVAWIKANPDKVTVGTAGVGAASHVSGVYFEKRIEGKVQFVPYRGAAPAMQDLVAGQIDIMFDQAANSLPQVRADKIKAYAVTSKTRLAAAPEIPTVDEAGLPGLYISVWHGLWVPKGTPKDIVTKLNAAVVEAVSDPAVREKFAALGQEIPPPAQLTPEALFAYHKAEIELWWPLIKAAGIKVE
ncbi:MAG TPA: tripartite tricarboxylate transporter substrate-binding protein [Vineibacter sp.]|nr:tripartite tricarboxylate transporter substrate-binding protein [Vineibacter sp.]